MSIRDEVDETLKQINLSKNISFDAVKQKYVDKFNEYLDKFFKNQKDKILRCINSSKGTIENVCLSEDLHLKNDLFDYDLRDYNSSKIVTDFFKYPDIEKPSFFYKEFKVMLPYHISLFIDMLIERTKKFDSKSSFQIMPKVHVYLYEKFYDRYGTFIKENDRYVVVFKKSDISFKDYENHRCDWIRVEWKYNYII